MVKLIFPTDGKPPVFRVEATDNTFFGYPDTTAVAVKKVATGGGLHMDLQSILPTVSNDPPSRKRKAVEATPLTPPGRFPYYLNELQENEILRNEGTTEDDDPEVDPEDAPLTWDDPDAFPEVPDAHLPWAQTVSVRPMTANSESISAVEPTSFKLEQPTSKPMTSSTTTTASKASVLPSTQVKAATMTTSMAEAGTPTSIVTIEPNSDFANATSLVITDTNFSTFLFGLLDGYMELNTPVQASSLSSTPTPLLLKNDDGLRRWWESLGSGGTSLSTPISSALTQVLLIMNATGDPDVDSLQFEMVLASGQSLLYESKLDVLKQNLGINASVLDIATLLDTRGLLRSGVGIILALNPVSPATTMTLLDLFHITGVTIPSYLQAAASSINFQIDNTQGANALWYYPLDNHFLTYRVAAVEPSSGGLSTTFNSLFSFLHCSFDKFTFFGSRDCMYTIDQGGDEQNVTSGQISLHTGLHLTSDGTGPTWDAYFTLSNDSLDLKLRWNNGTGSALDNFLAYVAQRLGLASNFFDTYTAWLNNTTNIKNSSHDGFTFREASITAFKPGGTWSFQSFKISFELDLSFGVDTSTSFNHIPFLLTFEYVALSSPPIITFGGRLWPTATPLFLETKKLEPDSHLVPPLFPLDQTGSQSYISLPALLESDSTSPSVKYPASIPDRITSASITLSSNGIALDCTLESSASDTGSANGTTPFLCLDRVKADAQYTFGSPAKLAVSFNASVVLVPRYYEPELDPAYLTGSISYTGSETSAYRFAGSLHDVDFATLYSLFPNADNDAVMNALEEFTISDFEIEYDYTSGGVGSTFTAGGVLELGPIDLSIDFQCNTAAAGSTGWSFEAHLFTNLPSFTFNLGDILSGISIDVANAVPEFLSSMNITINPSNDFVDLMVDKKIIDHDTAIVFSIIAKVGNLEFSFVQVSDSMPAEFTVKKRLLRITLDGLPPITSVPLLKKLEQPFDQIDFVWASEDLTRLDVEQLINPHFDANSVAPIYFKDPKTSTSDPTLIDPTDTNFDIVITAGCHFMIVVQESNVPTVVLDHAFDGGQTQSQPSEEGTLNIDRLSDGTLQPTPGTTSSSTGALTKKVGPLSISGIGLKYIAGDASNAISAAVQLSFSAKVMIGPVGGELMNFALNFPTSCIQHFDPSKLSVSIDGIGLELNAPPVGLAGLLLHSSGMYSGGISVEVEPYNFLAGGSYGVPASKASLQSTSITDTPSSTDYRSLFVFAEIDGPLVELEFATLGGIVAGFGYNDAIRVPTVDNVISFPFLASSTQTDPLKILDGYLNASDPWFTPQNGPMWVTAGLTAKAFHVLDLKTAILLDISPEDVVFGLFADATATVPADAASADELFALVDMGIIALVDFAKGTVKVEGQLTPKSYILSKDCHLSGGFALAYFFEGSGHNGDWVFTIGGYHPQFQVPQWYPNPPRVAITWQYDDNISIQGDAFFAITPKACMGGGHLHIAYNKTDLQADLDAYADFLINYSPFSFLADVGVNVNIVYHQNLVCSTKDWKVHFGASVHIWGPPVAGKVHVDWCIISFDVNFGNSNPKTLPISWDDFTSLLYQSATGVAQSEDDKALLSVKTTGGVVPDTDQSKSELHTTTAAGVLADASSFSFDVVTLVAANSVFVNGTDMFQDTVFSGAAATTDVPAFKPMRSSVKSTKLTVTAQNQSDKSNVAFQVNPIMKEVPKAIWAPCRLKRLSCISHVCLPIK